MTDLSHIHPNYRGMLEERQNQLPVANGLSETQAQLTAMDPGARWSHLISQGVYLVGGSEEPLDEDWVSEASPPE